MKKKLLVVGDSFMRPDPEYPGQHWSEMLPEYDVIMYSQSGASNGIIALRLHQGLTKQPDAVVLGFSFPTRLEFSIDTASLIAEQQSFDNVWITNSNINHISNEQQLLADLYQLHMDPAMLQLKECSIAASVLSCLTSKKIPFAWTLNGLFNNLSDLPYPSDPWVNTMLARYFETMTPTNLSTYQDFKSSPGFHTDDPEWQQRFAQEVREILQKPIDL